MRWLAWFLALTVSSSFAFAEPTKLDFDYDAVKKFIAPTELEQKVMAGEPDVDIGLRWRDKSGEHFFVIRRIYGGSDVGAWKDKGINYAQLNMHLYSRRGKSGAFEQERVLRDGNGLKKTADFCEETDQRLQHVDGSIGLSDVDNDGVGELSFAYYTPGLYNASLGDVASAPPSSDDSFEVCALVQELKLVVLEGNKKYILRGTVKLPGIKKSGRYRLSPPAKRWPKELLSRTKKQWKQLSTVDPAPGRSISKAHRRLLEKIY